MPLPAPSSRPAPVVLALWAALASACAPVPALDAGPAGPGTDAPETDAPGADATVELFAGALIDADHRTRDASVSFPSSGLYERITLVVDLGCPSDRCDAYDRIGEVSLVRRGADGEEAALLEIARFITPFGKGAHLEMDVTSLRPLLRGDVEVRVFIDTWVRAGSGFGDGWLVDARFELEGGVPEDAPFAVLPLWNQSVLVGDPAQPPSEQLLPAVAALPEGTRRVAVRALVTGHGQGNADNCAEFCPQEHALYLGDRVHSHVLWRDDCETTAVPDQPGTWRYPRAGWCPGATVHPWTLSPESASASSITAQYEVQPYENTCRPGVDVCTGCALGTGCDYDGGAHTEPRYRVSALLLTYR